MQELRFMMLRQQVIARFDVESSDEPADMEVEPAEYQSLVETAADGEQDGRGCRMTVGAFTPLGVSMALQSIGIDVDSLQEAVSGDADGGEDDAEDIPEEIMLESAPAHIRHQRMMLGLLNEK